MKYREESVDEMVLGLMFLTTFRESSGFRTWKGYDWEVLDRLNGKGFIGNPKSKSRSVEITEDGRKKSEEFFRKNFS